MTHYRLRQDLKRATLGEYALPLGIEPGDLEPPMQGYTLAYTPGEEDEPDTYAFHIVVSHEKIRPILHRVFDLLPDEVVGIVEINSRDSYRAVDVFLGTDVIAREEFLDTWQQYEPLLLEDAHIAAGANSEEPFLEIFLDQWKGVSIHVPLSMRDEVEEMLQALGLEEVPQTWSLDDNATTPDLETSQIRPILEPTSEFEPDLDEVLLDLRHAWQLALNVDPDNNVDEAGRELGMTLWHALVIVEPADGADDRGGYVSVWASARSMSEIEELIEEALEDLPEWEFSEIYTLDRVAYDERPDDLASLQPRRDEPEVHLVNIETWRAPPESSHDDPTRG